MRSLRRTSTRRIAATVILAVALSPLAAHAQDDGRDHVSTPAGPATVSASSDAQQIGDQLYLAVKRAPNDSAVGDVIYYAPDATTILWQGHVVCLAISGDRAVIGGTIGQTPFELEAVDDGVQSDQGADAIVLATGGGVDGVGCMESALANGSTSSILHGEVTVQQGAE